MPQGGLIKCPFLLDHYKAAGLLNASANQVFDKYHRILDKKDQRTIRRTLSFNQPEGNELQLFMGNYMVGRYLPRDDQWRIIRPFRLFVDGAAYKNFSPLSTRGMQRNDNI